MIAAIFANVKESLLAFNHLPIMNKPMIVISAGLHSGSELKFKEQISELQKDLVKKSTNSRQIIAEKSGHNMPFTQPEIIVNAVREMIELCSSTKIV